MPFDEKIKYIEKFVPKIDNWAICDTFCAGLKDTKKYPELMWEFIQEYLKSDREFEVRFVIVMMLDYYVQEKYIDKVLEILNKVKNEGYYVKMAEAWAISICYIKFPVQTMKFLKDNELDDFTYNKALQKLIESYRVSEKDKEKLKKMKR